jgi:hypothetical protein
MGPKLPINPRGFWTLFTLARVRFGSKADIFGQRVRSEHLFIDALPPFAHLER